MALTDNEKTKVIEMVTLATAVSHDKLIDAIKEQTAINTQLHAELKSQTEDINKIAAKVTNGMGSNISFIKDKVNVIENEVSGKEGTVNKI